VTTKFMTSHALMSLLKVCCGIFWNDIATLPVLINSEYRNVSSIYKILIKKYFFLDF